MFKTPENRLESFHDAFGLPDHTAHNSAFIARPGMTPYSQEKLDGFIAQIKSSPPSSPPAPSQGLYRPISNPYEIRVLEIKPGTGTEKLKGTLHYCTVEFNRSESGFPPRWVMSSADYSKPVFYTALSYTWGPEVFPCLIECDGVVKNITESLDSALRRFRHPDESIIMWIDQICINQEDETEKAQQVPLMDRIYTLATSTVIWLGEGNEKSDSAIKLLEQIVSCLQFDFSNLSFKDIGDRGLPAADSERWEHLCELLTRPWFTRVWIIQEAVLSLAETTWFACGGRFIPWKTLTNACLYLETCGISQKLQDRFPRMITAQAPLGEAISNIEAIKNSGFPQLFRFLTQTRNAQCGRPKDRVYGLVGLLNEKDKARIRVSYNDDYTIASLYQDVTVDHIRSDDLSPWMRLSLVLAEADHESSELPSWAPDWRTPPSTNGLNKPLAFSNVYNACGRFNHISNKGKPMAKIVGNELTTPGVLFDTIIRITDKFDNPDLSCQTPNPENATLSAAIVFASQMTENGPYGRCIFDALWKTLIAGRYDKGTSKPEKRKKTSDPLEPPFAEIFSFLIDETTGRSHSVPGQTYSIRQKRPKGKGGIELSSLGKRTLGQSFQEARIALRRALRGRRLGITSKGYLGLFPGRVAVGDGVYVFDRCPLPYVLRSLGSEGKFKFIGECYVHGIMDGEAVESADICLGGVTLV